MGSKVSKKKRNEVPAAGYEDPETLASETPFSVNEVEALHELYKKLSKSVVDDGYIQKEELAFALFKSRNKKNLFADRIFDLFDVKRNGRIDFGEFVRTLSIFHPRTPMSDKVTAAFKLYDLRHTGFIEREELKDMVLALLSESDLILSEDIVDSIVDKTFKEADSNGDGKIDEAEWIEYASENPLLLRNMTLPYLIQGHNSDFSQLRNELRNRRYEIDERKLIKDIQHTFHDYMRAALRCPVIVGLKQLDAEC